MDKIVAVLTAIADFWSSLIDIIKSITSFLISTLWFIFYWLKSLLIWVWTLLEWIRDSWVFINLQRAYITLSEYIWVEWVMFLSAMLFIVIVRIIVSFIMNLIKWNTKYTVRKTKRDIDDIEVLYPENTTYPRIWYPSLEHK